MPNRFKVKTRKASELPPDWFKRKKIADEKDSITVKRAVQEIIEAVRQRGDEALLEYTEKFDKTKLAVKDLKVAPAEIKAAYKAVTNEQIAALRLMKEKLEFQEKQTIQRQSVKTSIEGVKVQTVLSPLESVGCYVPGGQAVYPSTLVMTAAPPKVAGVLRVVVCSPPSEKGTISPLILVAADICGVDEVYKVGGVQAIAALAYGTKTVKSVRKIVGPGSKYVTEAKAQVSQDVAIDMPAGPSEVLVMADETAEAKLVAADMISQAEHGADSIAGLVTTSARLAEEVSEWLNKLGANAERAEIVAKSLATYGFIITCLDALEMVSLANAFAPEHLEIVTKTPNEIAAKITSAGLILIGPFSPVALSDYGSGTNHVLPTGGFGYAFSGLSVLDFVRRVSVVESSKEGLRKVKPSIKVFTEAERLPNHYRAVEARFEK